MSRRWYGLLNREQVKCEDFSVCEPRIKNNDLSSFGSVAEADATSVQEASRISEPRPRHEAGLHGERRGRAAPPSSLTPTLPRELRDSNRKGTNERGDTRRRRADASKRHQRAEEASVKVTSTAAELAELPAETLSQDELRSAVTTKVNKHAHVRSIDHEVHEEHDYDPDNNPVPVRNALFSNTWGFTFAPVTTSEISILSTLVTVTRTAATSRASTFVPIVTSSSRSRFSDAQTSSSVHSLKPTSSRSKLTSSTHSTTTTNASRTHPILRPSSISSVAAADTAAAGSSPALPGQTSINYGHGTSVGAIVGATIGGVAAAVLIFILAVCCIRRSKRSSKTRKWPSFHRRDDLESPDYEEETKPEANLPSGPTRVKLKSRDAFPNARSSGTPFSSLFDAHAYLNPLITVSERGSRAFQRPRQSLLRMPTISRVRRVESSTPSRTTTATSVRTRPDDEKDDKRRSSKSTLHNSSGELPVVIVPPVPPLPPNTTPIKRKPVPTSQPSVPAMPMPALLRQHTPKLFPSSGIGPGIPSQPMEVAPRPNISAKRVAEDPVIRWAANTSIRRPRVEEAPGDPVPRRGKGSVGAAFRGRKDKALPTISEPQELKLDEQNVNAVKANTGYEVRAPPTMLHANSNASSTASFASTPSVPEHPLPPIRREGAFATHVDKKQQYEPYTPGSSPKVVAANSFRSPSALPAPLQIRPRSSGDMANSPDSAHSHTSNNDENFNPQPRRLPRLPNRNSSLAPSSSTGAAPGVPPLTITIPTPPLASGSPALSSALPSSTTLGPTPDSPRVARLPRSSMLPQPVSKVRAANFSRPALSPRTQQRPLHLSPQMQEWSYWGDNNRGNGRGRGLGRGRGRGRGLLSPTEMPRSPLRPNIAPYQFSTSQSPYPTASPQMQQRTLRRTQGYSSLSPGADITSAAHRYPNSPNSPAISSPMPVHTHAPTSAYPYRPRYNPVTGGAATGATTDAARTGLYSPALFSPASARHGPVASVYSSLYATSAISPSTSTDSLLDYYDDGESAAGTSVAGSRRGGAASSASVAAGMRGGRRRRRSDPFDFDVSSLAG